MRSPTRNSCLLPHSQFVPCKLLPVCRCRSKCGCRTLGTTPSASTSPGPDCSRSTVSRAEAPVLDGPRARPAVRAVRARGTLDVLQGAAARPRRMREHSPALALTWACRPYTHTLLVGVHEGGSGSSGPPVKIQRSTAVLSSCRLTRTSLHVSLLGLGGKEGSVYMHSVSTGFS